MAGTAASSSGGVNVMPIEERPKFPFLDLKRLYSEQAKEIEEAVLRVMRSGWYLLGDECKNFEAEMKRDVFVERPGFVVGCNSGTDALILSMIASGVGPGTEVISVAHTAVPTIAAIVATGANPVFCDIDLETLLISVSEIEKHITARTKAILAVHLYGNMVNVHAIQALLNKLKRQDIVIVEDCAQAQGSQLKAESAGSICRFGAFSFYPSKNLAALGDGGAISCKTPEDEKRLKMLRFYGQETRYKAELARGINSRLDEVQAAVLRIRLKKMGQSSQKKSLLVDAYKNALGGLALQFQRTTESCAPSWHLFVVLCENGSVRDSLVSHLKQKQVETLIHYPQPNHRQKAFERFYSNPLPHTESVASRILSLPMNSTMTEADVLEISEHVGSFFK